MARHDIENLDKGDISESRHWTGLDWTGLEEWCGLYWNEERLARVREGPRIAGHGLGDRENYNGIGRERKTGGNWNITTRYSNVTPVDYRAVPCPVPSIRLTRIVYVSKTDIPSTNKRLLDEVASVPSKRLRNKISGCE